jgi:hypothetical protein
MCAVASICPAVACSGSSPDLSPTPSGAVTTTPEPAATSTEANTQLPLYGAYVRRVPSVKQAKAYLPGQHLWAIRFDQDGWKGVLHLSYLGRPDAVFRGRAYEYSADSATLRLGAERSVKHVGTYQFVVGGFTCRRDGAATYSWSRSKSNILLRLDAAHEPCAVRRRILEGEWTFSE